MYNKIIVLGFLTRDPELKYSSKTSKAVCNINIASTQKRGDRKETLFIDAVSFGKSAENINKFLKKGSPILIEGHLILESWTNKNGEKRYKHKIVINSFSFVSSKKNTQQKPSQDRVANTNNVDNYNTNINKNYYDTDIDINEEELPF